MKMCDDERGYHESNSALWQYTETTPNDVSQSDIS